MAGETTVPITAFSSVGQAAFRGYTALNRIQSLVFETAYRTNENMLICAPTGAGKTNIAMMAVLRCIEQHIEAGVIQRDAFKIVYVRCAHPLVLCKLLYLDLTGLPIFFILQIV
jgi:activating signal cointegrator complex subunit 3